MRQTRHTGRTSSTSASGGSRLDSPAARAGDPRAVLLQRWDELLRRAPSDMGLTAALGEGSAFSKSDPIAWLSGAADIPREALEKVRQVRNNVASNRPVPEGALSSALETLDRALAFVGRMRLPD